VGDGSRSFAETDGVSPGRLDRKCSATCFLTKPTTAGRCACSLISSDSRCRRRSRPRCGIGKSCGKTAGLFAAPGMMRKECGSPAPTPIEECPTLRKGLRVFSCGILGNSGHECMSSRFLNLCRELDNFPALFRRNPLDVFSEAVRYVELDYFCHGCSAFSSKIYSRCSQDCGLLSIDMAAPLPAALAAHGIAQA